MSRIVNGTGQLIKMKKMKRKKYHKNKLTQKDNYNPFDEIWFWLQLASIPIECQDKDDQRKIINVPSCSFN
jgi:hypothetical protein